MGSIDFENTVVFTLDGMGLDGLKNMLGELWEKLPEDIREDIKWMTQAEDKDHFNPGAVTAIIHLIAELSDGITKKKVTADQAEFLWEKMIDTLDRSDFFGPRVHILYKDYAKGDPMVMLGHILNISEDFLLAKSGIRKKATTAD